MDSGVISCKTGIAATLHDCFAIGDETKSNKPLRATAKLGCSEPPQILTQYVPWAMSAIG